MTTEPHDWFSTKSSAVNPVDLSSLFPNASTEEIEVIKEIHEKIDKLFEEIEKIYKIISSQNRNSDISYTETPLVCRNCKNHSVNGGSGICNCIFGKYNYYGRGSITTGD